MSRHANPSVLFLDLASTTGWALTHQGRHVSGSFKLKGDRFEGGGMRFLRFERQFLSQFAAVREIYYEEVRRHEGVDAAHIYGGLWGTLTKWCEERSIPYKGVGVGVIKKHWTGKGNANKEMMVLEARKRGFMPADDNEADAIAGLDYVISQQAAGA